MHGVVLAHSSQMLHQHKGVRVVHLNVVRVHWVQENHKSEAIVTFAVDVVGSIYLCIN